LQGFLSSGASPPPRPRAKSSPRMQTKFPPPPSENSGSFQQIQPPPGLVPFRLTCFSQRRTPPPWVSEKNFFYNPFLGVVLPPVSPPDPPLERKAPRRHPVLLKVSSVKAHAETALISRPGPFPLPHPPIFCPQLLFQVFRHNARPIPGFDPVNEVPQPRFSAAFLNTMPNSQDFLLVTRRALNFFISRAWISPCRPFRTKCALRPSPFEFFIHVISLPSPLPLEKSPHPWQRPITPLPKTDAVQHQNIHFEGCFSPCPYVVASYPQAFPK